MVIVWGACSCRPDRADECSAKRREAGRGVDRDRVRAVGAHCLLSAGHCCWQTGKEKDQWQVRMKCLPIALLIRDAIFCLEICCYRNILSFYELTIETSVLLTIDSYLLGNSMRTYSLREFKWKPPTVSLYRTVRSQSLLLYFTLQICIYKQLACINSNTGISLFAASTEKFYQIFCNAIHFFSFSLPSSPTLSSRSGRGIQKPVLPRENFGVKLCDQEIR